MPCLLLFLGLKPDSAKMDCAAKWGNSSFIWQLAGSKPEWEVRHNSWFARVAVSTRFISCRCYRRIHGREKGD